MLSAAPSSLSQAREHGLLHEQRLGEVHPSRSAVQIQRAADREVRQASAGVVEGRLVGDHAVVVGGPALDVQQGVAAAGRGAEKVRLGRRGSVEGLHELRSHVVRLLERLPAVVGQLLVIEREGAVGDAAALVAGVVAVGRVSERERRGLAGRAEADRLGAVDQRAVEAAAAEMDGLAVPLHRQVHGEVDGARLWIHALDGSANLAIVAQRVARGARCDRHRGRDARTGRGQADLCRDYGGAGQRFAGCDGCGGRVRVGLDGRWLGLHGRVVVAASAGDQERRQRNECSDRERATRTAEESLMHGNVSVRAL